MASSSVHSLHVSQRAILKPCLSHTSTSSKGSSTVFSSFYVTLKSVAIPRPSIRKCCWVILSGEWMDMWPRSDDDTCELQLSTWQGHTVWTSWGCGQVTQFPPPRSVGPDKATFGTDENIFPDVLKTHWGSDFIPTIGRTQNSKHVGSAFMYIYIIQNNVWFSSVSVGHTSIV